MRVLFILLLVMGLHLGGNEPRVQAVAQARADDMAARRYFAHITPEGDTVFTLLSEYVPEWQFAGEAICRTTGTVGDCHAAWQASPPHAALLADTRYVWWGEAEARSADGWRYVVLVRVQP